MPPQDLNLLGSPLMSVPEYKDMVKAMFNGSDANKDGVLQLDEFKQFSLCLLQST